MIGLQLLAKVDKALLISQKSAKTFFTQKLGKKWNTKDCMSHLTFEEDLEKKSNQNKQNLI